MYQLQIIGNEHVYVPCTKEHGKNARIQIK